MCEQQDGPLADFLDAVKAYDKKLAEYQQSARDGANKDRREILAEELVDRKSKINEALGVVWSTHADRLIRRASELTDHDLAKGVVVDYLMKLASKVRANGLQYLTMAYLLDGVDLECLGANRKRQRRREVSSTDPKTGEDQLPSLAYAGPGPVASLVQQESLTKLRDAITALPQDLQEVVVLYYFEGFTYEKIAEDIGNSSKTVGNRLAKARESLWRMLHDDA
jgi:RNA polymerase sigma factor (sigma-70 family)